MFPEFSSYSVEIKDSKFTREDGIAFPRTILLSLVSPDGYHTDVITLGFLEEDELFNMIDLGKAFDIDHCYIEQFSLADYRKQKGLEIKAPVEIHGFSARHCFFDNNHSVDFCYATFIDSEVSFEDSYFANGPFSLHACTIKEGGLNCNQTHFPDAFIDFINLHIEHGTVTFKNAIFGTGLIDFQDMNCGNGEVIFTNADFNAGDVSFVNANFGNGDISFKVARFGEGKIDFHYAKVGSGDISFERTEFGNGPIDFRTVEFGTGRINFNRAVFGEGDISFEASQLREGKLTFKKTVFGGGSLDFELAEYDEVDATFERAILGNGSISFKDARFRTLSLKSCHMDHYVDLRVARCKYIDLSDTIVRDIIDLMPYEIDIDVDIINFSGMRLLGRMYIDWDKNHVKQLIYSQEDTSKKIKAEQFRTLKENYNVTGQYSHEDKAYVEFKRLESKAKLEESVRHSKLSAIWMYPLYVFKLVVFDKAGLYATNPLRVMISMLVCYSFFSLLAATLTLGDKTYIISSLGESSMGALAKSFYYIAITFLTIGYGDYYPAGHLHWLAGIVGFVGLFLMSYFTVAFVRKVLR
jgi:hypothetical protein